MCKRSLHVIYSSWFIFSCGQNPCYSVILFRIKVQTHDAHRLVCVPPSQTEAPWLKICTFLVRLCPMCASKNHSPSSHIVKYRVLLHHPPCPNNVNKDKSCVSSHSCSGFSRTRSSICLLHHIVLF